MVPIKKVGARLRQLSEKQLCSIEKATQLAELPNNTVVEVIEMSDMTTVNGVAGAMNASWQRKTKTE